MKVRLMSKLLKRAAIVAVFAIALLFGACEYYGPAGPPEAGGRFGNSISTGTFTDSRDGKSYRTVRISGKTKTWMAENLDYTTTRSWCYDYADSNCAKYGRLYTWDAAMTACPAEWHLPTRKDWNSLVSTAGDSSLAGRRLKSTSGWNSGGNGTDDFVFSALPGGLYIIGSLDRYFLNAGDIGIWWSATDDWSESLAHCREMHYDNNGVNEGDCYKSVGLSVRCVRDW